MPLETRAPIRPIASGGVPRLLRPLTQRAAGARDRMFFTEQLALMLGTGVNLHTALNGLKAQTTSPAMRTVLEALEADVAQGRPFSYALSCHPQVFSATYVNLIAASENGGFMHEVLEQILIMEEKREALRGTLVSAFTYPAFLLLFSLLVVVFVLVVVFPKFGDMFVSIRDQLPPTTLALMVVSDTLRDHWIQWLAGLTGAVAVTGRWLATPAGAETVDRLKLRAPLLRGVFVELYLVHSMRVISLSLANGVTVMDALAACRDVVRNTVFRRFIAGLETRVQEGGGVAAGFHEAGFVPPIVRQMITTGEETGTLAHVTGRVADYYERELQKKLARLSKLAEPVMLLVMGLVVGVLVASLILPIFKLSRAVR